VAKAEKAKSLVAEVEHSGLVPLDADVNGRLTKAFDGE